MTKTVNPAYVQQTHRFVDNDAANESATLLGSNGDDLTGVDAGDTVRLRFLVQQTENANTDLTHTPQLWYSRNSGAYVQAGEPLDSDQYVRVVPIANITDGTATTQRIGSGTHTDGTLEDSASSWASVTFDNGSPSEVELEIAFVIYDAGSLATNDTIDLRVYFGGTELGGGYTDTPRITVSLSGGTTNVTETLTGASSTSSSATSSQVISPTVVLLGAAATATAAALSIVDVSATPYGGQATSAAGDGPISYMVVPEGGAETAAAGTVSAETAGGTGNAEETLAGASSTSAAQQLAYAADAARQLASGVSTATAGGLTYSVDAVVELDGAASTASAADLTYAADAARVLEGAEESAVAGIARVVETDTVLLDGATATAAAGDIAYAASAVRELGSAVSTSAAGDVAYAVSPPAQELTGASATSAAEDLTYAADAVRELADAEESAAAGTVGAAVTGNAEETLTGASATSAAEDLTYAADAVVTVTGAEESAVAGVVRVVETDTVLLDGASATSAAEDLTYAADVVVAVTGAEESAVAGTVSAETTGGATNVSETLAGASATATAEDVAYAASAARVLDDAEETAAAGTVTAETSDVTNVTETLASAASTSAAGTVWVAETDTVLLEGASATSAAGTVTAETTGNVNITQTLAGASATSAAATQSPYISPAVALLGAEETAAAGTVSAQTSGGTSQTEELASAVSTSAAGSVTYVADAVVELTGAVSTATGGALSKVDIAHFIGGAEETAAAGIVTTTVGSPVVTLEGASATSAAGDGPISYLVVPEGGSETAAAGTVAAQTSGGTSQTEELASAVSTSAAGSVTYVADAVVELASASASAQAEPLTSSSLTHDLIGAEETAAAGIVTTTVGSPLVILTGASSTSAAQPLGIVDIGAVLLGSEATSAAGTVAAQTSGGTSQTEELASAVSTSAAGSVTYVADAVVELTGAVSTAAGGEFAGVAITQTVTGAEETAAAGIVTAETSAATNVNQTLAGAAATAAAEAVAYAASAVRVLDDAEETAAAGIVTAESSDLNNVVQTLAGASSTSAAEPLTYAATVVQALAGASSTSAAEPVTYAADAVRVLDDAQHTAHAGLVVASTDAVTNVNQGVPGASATASAGDVDVPFAALAIHTGGGALQNAEGNTFGIATATADHQAAGASQTTTSVVTNVFSAVADHQGAGATQTATGTVRADAYATADHAGAGATQTVTAQAYTRHVLDDKFITVKHADCLTVKPYERKVTWRSCGEVVYNVEEPVAPVGLPYFFGFGNRDNNYGPINNSLAQPQAIYYNFEEELNESTVTRIYDVNVTDACRMYTDTLAMSASEVGSGDGLFLAWGRYGNLWWVNTNEDPPVLHYQDRAYYQQFTGSATTNELPTGDTALAEEHTYVASTKSPVAAIVRPTATGIENPRSSGVVHSTTGAVASVEDAVNGYFSDNYVVQFSNQKRYTNAGQLETVTDYLSINFGQDIPTNSIFTGAGSDLVARGKYAWQVVFTPTYLPADGRVVLYSDEVFTFYIDAATGRIGVAFWENQFTPSGVVPEFLDTVISDPNLGVGANAPIQAGKTYYVCFGRGWVTLEEPSSGPGMEGAPFASSADLSEQCLASGHQKSTWVDLFPPLGFWGEGKTWDVPNNRLAKSTDPNRTTVNHYSGNNGAIDLTTARFGAAQDNYELTIVPWENFVGYIHEARLLYVPLHSAEPDKDLWMCHHAPRERFRERGDGTTQVHVLSTNQSSSGRFAPKVSLDPLNEGWRAQWFAFSQVPNATSVFDVTWQKAQHYPDTDELVVSLGDNGGGKYQGMVVKNPLFFGSDATQDGGLSGDFRMLPDLQQGEGVPVRLSNGNIVILAGDRAYTSTDKFATASVVSYPVNNYRQEIVRGTGILSTGRIVVYENISVLPPGVTCDFGVLYSDDNGATWQEAFNNSMQFVDDQGQGFATFNVHFIYDSRTNEMFAAGFGAGATDRVSILKSSDGINFTFAYYGTLSSSGDFFGLIPASSLSDNISRE